jgi:hypothetical protein
MSLYGNVQERSLKRRSPDNFYNKFVGATVAEFMDGVLAHGIDNDFHTQHQYHIGLVDDPTTELVQLRVFGAWIRKHRPFGTTTFPHENANEEAHTASQDEQDLILKVYARDYALWQRAYGE